MGEDSDISQLEALEHETLRQLEIIRELKEKQVKKDNDDVSSDEDNTEKEFNDPRYSSRDPYISNYGTKPSTIVNGIHQSKLGSKSRYKGGIPVSNYANDAKIKIIQERIETERKPNLQKSKQDAKDSSRSLISQLQSRKQLLEQKRQNEAVIRSNFIEKRKMAFELPIDYKEVRVKINSLIQDKNGEELSLISKPLNYDKHRDPAYDRYSHKLLSYRFIEKTILDEIMKDVKPLTLSQFVAHCCPPSYDPPPYANFAIIGIVSQKSDILISSNNKKYRRVILTDFNVDIMLFIWDKALEKYQDVALGSIVAILNPQINSYSTTNGKFNSSGTQTSFNLKIENDINNMLIYARFRYFGNCGDVNRGEKCSTAIDKSKGRYCTYHFEKRFKKAESGRMDLTGSYHSFGSKDKYGNETVLYESKQDLEQLGKVQRYGPTAKIAQPIHKKTFHSSTVLPNYDDPSTKSNMLEPYQRSEQMFTSSKASLAFYNEKVTNVAAVKEQIAQHKLDKRIMRERAKRDYEANIKMKQASEAELHRRSNADKKRNIVDTLSNLARSTEKNLEKSKRAKRLRAQQWKHNLEKLDQLKKRKLLQDKDGLKMVSQPIKETRVVLDHNNTDSDNESESEHFAAFKRKFKSK